MTGISESITDLIGETPLLALDRITRVLDGRILAKIEFFNPGYSKKDRAALEIILEAEKSGALAPGQTVVELTSGNMGTGLAIVCRQSGHPFVAVMSRGNSIERAKMMRAFGAEVVIVDQAPNSVLGEVSGDDLKLVEERTRQLTKERGAFRADQFGRRGNMLAHYRHTGPEIWRQSGGAITAFCDFVGSGGSFAGVSTFLKEQDREIACYVVEPEGAAALAGEAVSDPGHPIQGGGYSMSELALMDGAEIDGYLTVGGAEARATARLLAREEGVFGGFSGGANVAAALKLLRGPQKGATIAVLICDSGMKYLSTNLWD
ncbi:MAG TPA: cysteine synthase family protein [Parvularculaceae bacterium]|nr:cysteine synthase family protein [Parvularculaceae bacterium]